MRLKLRHKSFPTAIHASGFSMGPGCNRDIQRYIGELVSAVQYVLLQRRRHAGASFRQGRQSAVGLHLNDHVLHRLCLHVDVQVLPQEHIKVFRYCSATNRFGALCARPSHVGECIGERGMWRRATCARRRGVGSAAHALRASCGQCWLASACGSRSRHSQNRFQGLPIRLGVGRLGSGQAPASVFRPSPAQCMRRLRVIPLCVGSCARSHRLVGYRWFPSEVRHGRSELAFNRVVILIIFAGASFVVAGSRLMYPFVHRRRCIRWLCWRHSDSMWERAKSNHLDNGLPVSAFLLEI